ncbi:hypothetical protein [Roseibium sp.]|uniref:hypothetical protein n=1 Tax=Roseibium sp. TaxID=1936156 RepID=UPI003D0DCAE1
MPTLIAKRLGLGILALFDRSVNLVTLSLISFPEFLVAYILIVLLAETCMFPSMVNLKLGIYLGEKLYRTFLPALKLTLVVITHMRQMTRVAIINGVNWIWLTCSSPMTWQRQKQLPLTATRKTRIRRSHDATCGTISVFIAGF